MARTAEEKAEHEKNQRIEVARRQVHFDKDAIASVLPRKIVASTSNPTLLCAAAPL